MLFWLAVSHLLTTVLVVLVALHVLVGPAKNGVDEVAIWLSIMAILSGVVAIMSRE